MMGFAGEYAAQAAGVLLAAAWRLTSSGPGRPRSGTPSGRWHSPQVIVPTTPALRQARLVDFFAAYGLGWQVMDYRGHAMLWHSGNGDEGEGARTLTLQSGRDRVTARRP